mmetsp:Transcript_173880/g.557323  ORF Transcript_173880/g.557323 Transcript_173880/m.557323 type:complete len:210 (+) Transcript_173880:247-876(+)
MRGDCLRGHGPHVVRSVAGTFFRTTSGQQPRRSERAAPHLPSAAAFPCSYSCACRKRCLPHLDPSPVQSCRRCGPTSFRRTWRCAREPRRSTAAARRNHHGDPAPTWEEGLLAAAKVCLRFREMAHPWGTAEACGSSEEDCTAPPAHRRGGCPGPKAAVRRPGRRPVPSAEVARAAKISRLAAEVLAAAKIPGAMPVRTSTSTAPAAAP